MSSAWWHFKVNDSQEEEKSAQFIFRDKREFFPFFLHSSSIRHRLQQVKEPLYLPAASVRVLEGEQCSRKHGSVESRTDEKCGPSRTKKARRRGRYWDGEDERRSEWADPNGWGPSWTIRGCKRPSPTRMSPPRLQAAAPEQLLPSPSPPFPAQKAPSTCLRPPPLKPSLAITTLLIVVSTSRAEPGRIAV